MIFHPAKAPHAAKGAVTQKIQCQDNSCRIRPPRVGPAQIPTACAEAKYPMARPRASGPAAETRMTTLLAPRSAPAMPCRTRQAMSHGRLGAKPQRTEKSPNSANPATYMILRPPSSASLA